MSICVHPVDYDSERGDVLGVLQTNLPALPHALRFDWLYHANPDGPAWCWLARQGGPAGEPIGVTSLFPRSMWVGGRVKLCGQVGDFAVSASHRSLGPALSMQRATMGPVDRGALAFCYDCPPHAAGMATFRRLGLRPIIAMERYSLPLRVDRKLERCLGFNPRFVAAAGNILMRLYAGRGVRARGLTIEEHAGPFGEEFSRLDESLDNTRIIRSRRSAAHLNWRYREDPLNRYRAFTARRRGELIAFLVFSATNESLVVVDLFGAEFPASALTLLESLRESCGPGCQGIEICLSEGNEAITPLLRKRYRRRGVAAQVVAYAAPGSETAAFLKDGARWSFQGVDIRA